MTSERSPRSYVPLTAAHLERLREIADEDHHFFTRPTMRPEYRGRRVAVVLAQGGALHFVDGTSGVKDLDVWTFYAQIKGGGNPFGQRKRFQDFGASDLGRNLYPPEFEHPQLKRWLRFNGRKVDLMIRTLPTDPEAPAGSVVEAIQSWLRSGASQPLLADEADMPSNWHLAQKAVVLLDPDPARVVWPI